MSDQTAVQPSAGATVDQGAGAGAADQASLLAGQQGQSNVDAAKATADAAAATEAAKSAEAAKAAEGAVAQVPEKYDFKVPEGMTLDTALVAKVEPIFKELKLTQEGAQKLVDSFAEYRKADAQAQTDAWAKTQQEWIASLKDDKDFGGTNFDANLGKAQTAVALLEGKVPGFRDMLKATGMDNNPHMVRGFAELGKMMAEDKFETGQGSAKADDSPAKRMFGNSMPNP